MDRWSHELNFSVVKRQEINKLKFPLFICLILCKQFPTNKYINDKATFSFF